MRKISRPAFALLTVFLLMACGGRPAPGSNSRMAETGTEMTSDGVDVMPAED